MVLCWNELPYLKNMIPQLEEVFEEIVILDGYSTDGTKAWGENYKSPKCRFYQRQFDCCANQFDYALQKMSKDNTWVLNITADELPTTWLFENIREITNNAEAMSIDRIFMSAYHLRGEREISSEIGGQLRLFRNDIKHKCIYTDAPHERLHGKFSGHCMSQPDERFAYVHFRQADLKKVELWRTHYIEKGVYSLWDINRRLNIPTIKLPDFVKYKINDELREYLKW